MNTRAYGNIGEQAACDYLSGRGWNIIARNVRMGRNEIDIIAEKKKT
ncbi:MAG: YraN family protein, partial [Clostridia bacterium]|nr:YraN family protein [Clostridia bacterium]